MAVRVAGLAFGGRAEQRGHVVLAFDVGLVCEVQIAAVGLRFAGEGVLQIVVGLGTFEALHRASPSVEGAMLVRLRGRHARRPPRVRAA